VAVLTSVAAIALPPVAPFELGVLCEVFGIDRTEHGVPAMDFAVVTARPGPVPTTVGFALDVPQGLERAAVADLVAVAAYGPDQELPDGVAQVLQDAVRRGARVLSVCTGAFALGAAGLLDGRRCTTHWMHARELAARYPTATVDPDVLYVEDGPVITSAGSAAGIDACLHVLRIEHGVAAAAAVARRMVVPPHRDGGQAQFVSAPVPHCEDERMAEVLDWMLDNLAEELPVDALARRAAMSPRTFARRFRDATGTTPGAWLNRMRLDRARELLERTDLPVETIAQRVGFGASAVLRHHFGALGTTPQAYRRTFAGSSPSSRAG
jgi:transcriptional regulator GlxA family with amidase domain